jgi:hypothetical protein
MALTNFPNGVSSFGVPVGGLFTNGNPWFVKPGTGTIGNDGNDGTSLEGPLATLAAAHTLATAGANDVVYMIASSDTAANTTDYLSTTLLWSKDMVHLVGINSGQLYSPRSRVANLSTATAASVSPLVTWSSDASLCEGVQFFFGLASASAIGNVLVSGSRNVFRRCHFAGIGDATMDVSTNYSLKVTGSENLFEECVIGLDTIQRTAASAELLFDSGATRNVFRRCRIVTYGTANHLFLKVPSNGIDRDNTFEDCTFINMPTGISAGTTMTQGFSITGGGSPDGAIILKNCMFTGVTNVETSASGKVLRDNYTSKAVATTVPSAT